MGRRSSFLCAAAVPLLVALAAAGCGGASNSGSPSGGSPGGSPTPGYWAKVATIEDDLAAKVATTKSSSAAAASKIEALGIVSELAATFDSLAVDLQGLAPPVKVAPMHSQALTYLQKGVAHLRTDLDHQSLGRAEYHYSKFGNRTGYVLHAITLQIR